MILSAKGCLKRSGNVVFLQLTFFLNGLFSSRCLEHTVCVPYAGVHTSSICVNTEGFLFCIVACLNTLFLNVLFLLKCVKV